MGGPKHTYATLDGIRGVAALCIVVRHAPGLFPYLSSTESYLAVDLFFCLSGFVLAHAYDHRLREQQISWLDFMRVRAIRLYPLYLLGLTIGVIAALLTAPEDGGLPAQAIAMSAAVGLLMLPYPGTAHLFPLNGPAWSLFFEVIANAGMGFGPRRLTDLVLLTLCAVSGCLLISMIIRAGHADLGWTWGTFPVGLARVGFSFSAGLLAYRHRERFRMVIPPLIALSITLAALSISPPSAWRAPIDIGCIIAFPLLVLFSANAEPRFPALFRSLGRLSYPAYAVHAPLALMTEALVSSYWVGERPSWMGWAFLAAIAAISTALSRYFDEPVRRGLTQAAQPRVLPE